MQAESFPPRVLIDRVAGVIGRRPAYWRPVHSRGYTPAELWVITLESGDTAFVKAAMDPGTGGELRKEYRVYSQLEAPFLPRMLAWHDDGDVPVLVLDDLSEADWPPPWDDRKIKAVLKALDNIHRARVDGLPSILESEELDLITSWTQVAADPARFLALGLCSTEWLDKAWRVLDEANRSAQLAGDDLLHVDVRSDNICIDGRAVFVDWNYACRGNALLDLACLPSLAAEGGAAPEAILPEAPEWAALNAGYFAAHAGQPQDWPRLREVRRQQLRISLPWAVRSLGLPPLDGPNAPEG